MIQQLEAQKITPTRFNIDLPKEQLANALYASYVAELRVRHKRIIFDDDTKEHIRVAAEWLGDAHGKFGFMMSGLYGNGKTTLLLAMCNLINYLFDSVSSSTKKSIRVLKAKDIARMAIDKEQRAGYERLYYEDMLAIDDIGEEPAEIISYGMVFTPIRDLLEERYSRQKFTIVTTNLVQNPEKKIFQIQEHYGERVVDRFREMMKIVPFHNPTYRKCGD